MRHITRAAQIEAQAFARLAPMDKVPVSALFMTFRWDYSEWQLTGYRTESASAPYTATRLSDGERRGFSAVLMCFIFGEVRR